MTISTACAHELVAACDAAIVELEELTKLQPRSSTTEATLGQLRRARDGFNSSENDARTNADSRLKERVDKAFLAWLEPHVPPSQQGRLRWAFEAGFNAGRSDVDISRADAIEAAFMPVNDWYESDEHPPRPFAEKLTDAVADLQSDRAELLKARRVIPQLLTDIDAFDKSGVFSKLRSVCEAREAIRVGQ